MLLPDVNVLVHAFRPGAPDHVLYRDWLAELIAGPSAYACSDHVLSGFLRVVTDPWVFANPDPIENALEFADSVRSQPSCLRVSPGASHWSMFVRLCRETPAIGNLVPDAYFAALAIESGCEWITTDRDFARFPGLRWRYPLS